MVVVKTWLWLSRRGGYVELEVVLLVTWLCSVVSGNVVVFGLVGGGYLEMVIETWRWIRAGFYDVE